MSTKAGELQSLPLRSCTLPGNGILTIARGSVPLALYGPVNYGYRLGFLGPPSRVAQAAAPLLFGMLIDEFGAGTFVVSAALGLAALAALCIKDRENHMIVR